MLNYITTLGKKLNSAQQRNIQGGISGICPSVGMRCNAQYPSLINCISDVDYCCVDGKFKVC